jgi:hypothetical protein
MVRLCRFAFCNSETVEKIDFGKGRIMLVKDFATAGYVTFQTKEN